MGYGFAGANSFSSRNSMALIIDNETLIISLNVLIKSPLSSVSTRKTRLALAQMPFRTLIHNQLKERYCCGKKFNNPPRIVIKIELWVRYLGPVLLPVFFEM